MLCVQVAENSLLDSWNDEEKEGIKHSMINEWEKAKSEIVSFFAGIYTNWNPCYTSRGDLTGTYKLPNITTINPSDIIDACLDGGNLCSLDQLYCNIVNSYCRHIVHRGTDGKPAKTDYCYKVELVKDKKASMEKGKVVRKEVIKCTRRKPQKKQAIPAIHADPHDKKIYQVTFECNDEWFNGADPFMILLILGNADTKALVHSMFTKRPKFKFSEADHTAEMTFNLNPGDSAVEYVIKYMQKAPVPIQTPQEIYANVLKKMDHAITKEGVYQVYIRAAIQGTIPLLTAQHVNLRLQQVFRNTVCTPINVLGRKTLKRLASPDNDSFLNENRIDEFEARFNLSRYSTANPEEVQCEMSMHQFFDKYCVSFDKQKQLIVHERKRFKYNRKQAQDVYQSIRLTPHTTMIQANPSRKTYGTFCKKMCLWEKPYLSIRNTIRTFTTDQKEEEDKYWIDEFQKQFPGGEGLENYAFCYVKHYEKKNLNGDNDSETDETDDEEENNTTSQSDASQPEGNKNKDNQAKQKTDVTGKREKPDRFYQTTDDLLLKPLNDDIEDADCCIVNDELNTLSTEYMANAKLEDLTKWLPAGENPKISKIEMTYTKMKQTCGEPLAVYESRPLTKKQKMVKRIIMDWVHDRLGERKMDPLRLFALGLPGVGKTFAFKITATEMMNTLGDDWQDKVRFATPTGSVSFHMGFNAQTLHRTFYIRVGHEGEVFEGIVDKILQIKKLLPNTIIIIIFDECSMIPRRMFAAICNRLEEAGIDMKDVGFVFFGDPAQISPIGGLPLWSTEITGALSMKGMVDFRDLMGMKPLVDIKGYRKLKSISKAHQEYEKYYQQVGQSVYEGKYNAIYMDEVMRTDYSKLSEDLKDIQLQGRYGNFTVGSLARLKSITASEPDLNQDPEWQHKTTLTGFHYYSETNPERSNADSINAGALIDYSNATGNGILRFEAIHSPAEKSIQMSSLTAKDFQNLAANLHLAYGARIILSMNINPSLGLFNGAAGKVMGALYLSDCTYEVNSLQIIKSAAVDERKRTTKQVKLTLPSGKNVQLPRGTVLTSVNGDEAFDCEELKALQEPFSAHFQIPRRPPFLPDYITINFPGYAELGGPPFFENPSLKDCVCLKPETFGRKETSHALHRTQQTRTCFPLELAYVMTAFKGIGDNHCRTELMLHGNFSKPGLFLVGISRVVNPQHLYIHPEHWPSHLELRTQRLNDHVLQSENFERFIRVVSARDMRHYGFDLLDNIPEGIDKDLFNFIADQIYLNWSHGIHDREDICKSICASPIDANSFVEVYDFMKSSDEYLITKKVPNLSRKERYYLENVVQNKKRGITGVCVGKMANKTPISSTKQKQPVLPSRKKNIPPLKTASYTPVSAKIVTDKPSSSKRKTLDLTNRKMLVPSVATTMTSTCVSKLNNVPVGLYNVGNTCFINAALQMFRTLPCQWYTMIASTNTLERTLCSIMDLLVNNNRDEPITQRLLINFKHEVNTVMNNNVRNQQQDTQEAITKMMETSAWLSQYVMFHQNKNTYCMTCENLITVFSENTFLLLHPSRRDMPLQECIDVYLTEEKVDDYVCQAIIDPDDHICRSKEIYNVTSIDSSPPVIFIQLGQLGHNDHNGVSIDSQILIMGNVYMFKSAIQYDGIMESGEAAGHYIAYTEVNGEWFKFDDSRVNRVSIGIVKKAAQKCYILCYIKR